MSGTGTQTRQPGAEGATAPSPAQFFQAAHGLYQSYALKAAVDLDVFTAIAAGAETVAAIAERCQASARGIRVLCDYLALLGFITKNGERYAATPDTAFFLSRRSPAYVGGALNFLMSGEHIDAMRDLGETVRKGTRDGQALEPNRALWVTFARSMAPLMVMPSRMMAERLGVHAAGPLHVLDIAAGHGLFGLAVASANPKAEITAVDWAPVLEVAKQNAAGAGASDRYRTIAGSALTVDLGTGYDLVLLPNFLHHFDEAGCVTILKRMHVALKNGGRVAVLEFVPDESRQGPPMAVAFSLTMLANTPGGDAYRFSDLRRMLETAGFRQAQHEPLMPGMSELVTAVK
ncbi:MAG TPA: methyltransferase [Vicinamibacterales bacterium]|jgi:SAM-dependent methyltransferase